MSVFTDNLPDLSQGYCVIDTETTGLDQSNDRIIEVCVLVQYPGRKPITRTSLVASVDAVPAEITRITGIDTQMVQSQGELPARIYDLLFSMPEVQTLPVVGHNIIGFDRQFLLNEAKRLGAQCFADACEALNPDRLVDTGGLYKGIRLGESPRPDESHYEWVYRVLEIHSTNLYWNLTAAARAYGVPWARGEPHRARTDTITCQRLFQAILDGESKKK